jgi:WD40 repeat protein
MSVHLWNESVSREVGCISLPGDIRALVCSPDGRSVATADASPSVRVWEDPLKATYTEIAHDGLVNALAFSADGKHLGVASADRIVRIYDIQNGQEVARIEQDEAITSLAFSPDGRFLAAGSYDSTGRLWMLETQDLIGEACRRLTRTLTREEWQQYLGDEPYEPACLDAVDSPVSAYSYLGAYT